MTESARPSNVVAFPFARVTWFSELIEDCGRSNLDWDDNVVPFPFRPYEPDRDEPILDTVEEV